MFKFYLLIALAIAGVQAQSDEAPAEGGAPEPYSYAYATDTHSAEEQKDPNGRVTGYYTLADADGRQRRVEYVADENGFRAKVQTNEVGTKSENSADVEVLAAPPTREQLVYTEQPQQQTVVAQQPQRAALSQVVAAPQGYRYGYQQQPYYGYNYGYGYQPSYGYAASDYNQQYGYGANYASPYGYYSGYGRNYNNHLPSSYYRSLTQAQPAQARGYVGSTGVSSVGYQTVGQPQVAYQTVGQPEVAYQTVGQSGVAYQTVGQPGVAYQTVAVKPVSRSSTAVRGSSNYVVLQKRDSTSEKKKEQSS